MMVLIGILMVWNVALTAGVVLAIVNRMLSPQEVIAQTLKTIPETGTYESDAQAILDALEAWEYVVVRRNG